MMEMTNTFTRKKLVLLCACMTAFSVFTQIPTRFIVNSGFELPVTGCSPASYSFILQTNVPGWRTLDSVPAPMVTCGTSGSNSPYLIELWTNGFNSRASHSGSQFAEINASQATFLYQEICMLANEQVSFSVWHLRRAGSGNGEQMVAELKTTTNSNIATASIDTAKSTWKNYTGTLTNNSSSGIRRYGFRAISGGSLGNLIDDVKIYLKPLVDIKDFKFSTIYETDTNSLRIYVNGTLYDTATVTITKSGSATYNSDYVVLSPNRGSLTFNSSGDITLTLPPGDYDPNSSSGSTAGLILIPFVTINESVTESNETLTYTITGSSNGGGGNSALNLATSINGQSASCATTVGASQFTIIDIIGLPVKLISFNAIKEVGLNLIQWEVAEESNLYKYILEYSLNGIDFTDVDEIIAYPLNYNNYTSTHRLAKNNLAYYRLAVIDKMGNRSVLSSVITLSENPDNAFSVFPNPNNGSFTVNFYSSKANLTVFNIYDIFGKKVDSVMVNAIGGNNTVPVSLYEDLSQGIYYIEQITGTYSKTLRISILK